jgi:hypothetical protein
MSFDEDYIAAAIGGASSSEPLYEFWIQPQQDGAIFSSSNPRETDWAQEFFGIVIEGSKLKVLYGPTQKFDTTVSIPNFEWTQVRLQIGLTLSKQSLVKVWLNNENQSSPNASVETRTMELTGFHSYLGLLEENHQKTRMFKGFIYSFEFYVGFFPTQGTSTCNGVCGWCP